MVFSLRWLFLLGSTGYRMWGLQYLRHIDSVVVVPGLSCAVACGIFPDQESSQIHVSCIGRWILYHWATRGAPNMFFIKWSPCLSAFIIMDKVVHRYVCLHKRKRQEIDHSPLSLWDACHCFLPLLPQAPFDIFGSKLSNLEAFWCLWVPLGILCINAVFLG